MTIMVIQHFSHILGIILPTETTNQSRGPPSHPIRPGSAPGLVAGGSGKFERDNGNGGIAWEIDVYIYIYI